MNKNWIREESVVKYIHNWQKPALTEEWVADYLIRRKSKSSLVEYIAFPWAQYIDLSLRKREEEELKLKNEIKKLKFRKTIVRVTACQHINLEPILEVLEDIGITDLFWAHKTNATNKINNIRIHPLPLFPYAFAESQGVSKKNFQERKILFSFIGAYDPKCYLSDIRKNILNIKNSQDRKIIERDEWFFESQVYREQIYGEKQSIDSIAIKKNQVNEYSKILEETKFSLCPSGSGPNSIRLWESICFGCIPIILSDTFDDSLLENKYKYIKIDENKLLEFLENIENLKVENGNKILDYDEFLEYIYDNFFRYEIPEILNAK